MRIGIITYWSSSDNYGQQLQCFALQKYIKGLGHDAYLIKYMPISSVPLWRRIVRSIKYRLLVSSEQKENDKKNAEISSTNELLNAKRNFVGFRNNYIDSTDIVYHSIHELRANPPKADVYICGSDQVWNNRLEDENTAGWFLDFGSPKTRRLSYAASIGREIDSKEYESFSKYLKRFDAISVREQKANDFCHHLGFEKSIVAIDPTLLLKSSDYNVLNNGIKKEGSSKPYAFIYLLNIRNSDEVYWDEFHKMIQENDLSVRVVASSGYLPAQDFLPGYQNEQATIPEWLSLIKHSEFVITTSFHGVVFCLLNHKPFYAVLLNNEFSKGNDRIISLLKTVGLEKKIVSSASDINSIKFVEINWDNVDEKLSKLRKESIDFLNKEL